VAFAAAEKPKVDKCYLVNAISVTFRLIIHMIFASPSMNL
jgi:hypothetical protein